MSHCINLHFTHLDILYLHVESIILKSCVKSKVEVDPFKKVPFHLGVFMLICLEAMGEHKWTPTYLPRKGPDNSNYHYFFDP